MLQSKPYFYMYGMSCFNLTTQSHYPRNSPLSYIIFHSIKLSLPAYKHSVTFFTLKQSSLKWRKSPLVATLPVVLFSSGPKHFHRVISTYHFQVLFFFFCFLSLFLFLIYFYFLKDFIFLFLDRGEGREKERERNISVWLLFTLPPLGTWPATQVCALTGN